MKKIALLIILLLTVSLSAQKKKSAKMGQTTLEELKMKVYDQDTTAVALVLYEQGNTYINESKNYDLSTDYYFRVKILKKEGFEKGIIEIPFYKKESVTNIKAYTYNVVANIIQRKILLEKDIFKNNETENWKTISFTLPDLKVGSVIEYRYTLNTPYYFNLNSWHFQSDIPKLNSEYDSSILSNYKYNIGLRGYLKLTKNNPSIERRCIKIPGLSEGDCNVISIGMKNIPAFKEEDYMTAKKNFISRVRFDLEYFVRTDGSKNRYTDSWKSVDKKFKSGEYFGSELRKTSFFKKNIPVELLSTSDILTKTKSIYYFVQNHYTKNNDRFSYRKINTKKSFTEKTGTTADINIALYNALQAAGIESYIALLSTRNNGVPLKIYPVINDFNYVVVKAIVNDKSYFLDASDKNLEFGLTPFQTLNGDVRVMDFKKGSYWEPLTRTISSSNNINLSIKISNEGIQKEMLRIAKTGYSAYSKRKELNTISSESYLEKYESKNNIIINDYKITGEENTSPRLVQIFNIEMDNSNNSSNSENLYLNPFFHEKMTENPFKLDERLFPVDFGYKRNYTYRASIEIPSGYKVVDLPKSKAMSLPNNGGNFIYQIKQLGENKITLFFKYKLNKVAYYSDEYFALKEIFNQIIKVQSTVITLKKKI